jgi:hypothetical protein
MKILFIESQENGYLEYYAISQMEVYKGKLHDELFWAELRPDVLGMIGDKDCVKVQLTWEDDFYNKLYFDTLDEAKKHVNDNWFKHSPHVNGHVHDTD